MTTPNAPTNRNRAQAELIDFLGRQGTWTGRAQIDTALGWSTQRLDDELGDLVMAGTVQFNERARSYRLMGPPLARAALRRMLTDPGQLAGFELGQVSPDGKLMRIGLARRVAQAGAGGQAAAPALLMAELELPFPGGKDPAALDNFLRDVGAALTCQAMGGAMPAPATAARGAA